VEADHLPGSPRVALISHGVWLRQFGANPDVVGQTLQSTSALTYGAPTPVPADTWTIIGVMPADFQWPVGSPDQIGVWVPYVVPENQRSRDGARSAPLHVTGRLTEGVTVEGADSKIRAFTSSLAEQHPEWFPDSRGAVRSLHEATVGSARAWMLLLLGAVGVVLLIACANVANLTLSRALARGREMQTRIAIGASRWRIARGLMVESLVLTIAGTLLGLLVAVWGIDVLRAALPDHLPRISTVALNLRVLGFSALACVATGLLFGLAPALQLSRRDPRSGVRDGSRGATSGTTRLRSALVVSQIALAVILTIGAGLFLTSFIRVTNVEMGLDPRNVLTMRVWPRFDSSQPGWATPAAARSMAGIKEVVQRVAAIPGVEAVGFMAGDLPLTGYSARAPVVVPGRSEPFDNGDRVQVRHVTPGYARAVGTPVVRGRYLNEGDISGATPVVVLNEEAAARYFGDREAIGATLSIERGYAPHVTVVGVVGNVRLFGPESAVRPEAYLPLAQASALGGALAIRTHGEPLALAADVGAAVRESFPELPAPKAAAMTSLLGGLIAQRRFNLLVVALFGGLALAIGGVGLYGVMAYQVTQRTREIGVRLALGASPSRVQSTVLTRGLALTTAGVVIGMAAAWPLATYVQSFLFQVALHDPTVFVAAATLLLSCGVVATFIPARRAARVDPLIALRAE
jgi:predicted permease